MGRRASTSSSIFSFYWDDSAGAVVWLDLGTNLSIAGTTLNAAAGAVAVEDEGVLTVSSASTLNFTGTGVTVTDAGGGEATVTIAGGAAPVDSVFGRTGAVVAAEGDYDLEQLGDVAIAALAAGEILGYNGSTWLNQTLAEAGIAAASHTHAASEIASGTLADARVAASNVTQHQAALSITESQISDLQSYSLNDPLAVAAGAFNPAAVSITSNRAIHSTYTQSGAVTFTLSSGTANGGEIFVPFISDGGALTWSAQFVSGVTGSNGDLPATLPSGQQTLIFQRDVTADVVRVFLAQSTAAEVSYNNTTSGLAATNVKAALDELTSEKANLSGGNSWMGTQDYNGATVQGLADLVITRGATSSQPTVAESGAWITSDGAITIPNTKVGWKCFLELGGDHDITFNSQTYDTGTGAAGDIYQILVKSASVIRMSPVTPAADVITEADFI